MWPFCNRLRRSRANLDIEDPPYRFSLGYPNIMSMLAIAAPATVAIPPVAVTAGRLTALDPFAGFEVMPVLDEFWRPLAPDRVDAMLDSMLALLAERHGARATAGSLLGEAVIRTVILGPVAAMVLDLRCPDPSADNLAVRFDEEGEFARAAVLRPTIAVLATDGAARDPDSVVVEDLVAWWAERTAATLVPLLGAVRARAPFGLPALWGAVADEVASIVLWTGQLAGVRPGRLWVYAGQLVNALAPYAPVRMARPRPFPVPHPAGGKWFRTRGTCCLYYRSELLDGPREERLCGACPLRDDESRHRHLHDYLTRRHT
jgi:hypothetical protein